MILDIPDAAAEWLKTGERGISSEAIFAQMTGIAVGTRWSSTAPGDPADLRRCRLLLEQVPEFMHRFHDEMAAVPGWAALVKSWAELCLTMEVEAPDWRDGMGGCPKTYALMNKLRGWP